MVKYHVMKNEATLRKRVRNLLTKTSAKELEMIFYLLNASQ